MSLLACGDVGGSVYLFDTTKTNSKECIIPSHVASRAHGKFAVNVVTWHHSSKDLYVVRIPRCKIDKKNTITQNTGTVQVRTE